MFYIAKTTPEDLNFSKFSECEVLSAGNATAMNKMYNSTIYNSNW